MLDDESCRENGEGISGHQQLTDGSHQAMELVLVNPECGGGLSLELLRPRNLLGPRTALLSCLSYSPWRGSSRFSTLTTISTTTHPRNKANNPSFRRPLGPVGLPRILTWPCSASACRTGATRRPRVSRPTKANAVKATFRSWSAESLREVAA